MILFSCKKHITVVLPACAIFQPCALEESIEETYNSSPLSKRNGRKFEGLITVRFCSHWRSTT